MAKKSGDTPDGKEPASKPKRKPECKTLHWTAGRFRAAKKVLLAANYIRVVEAGMNSSLGHVSQQYTLVR